MIPSSISGTNAGVALLNVRGQALGAAGFVGFVSIIPKSIPAYLALEVLVFVLSFGIPFAYAMTRGKADMEGRAPAAKAAAPVVKKPEPPKQDSPEKKPEAPKPQAPKAEEPKHDNHRPERKPEAPRQEKPKAPRQERPKAEPRKEVPVRPYTAPEAGSVEEKIEVFLKGLMERMGSQANAQCTKVDANTYKVELVGEDLGYLIGRRGDTLDAIQHLANYTINRDVEGHIRVNVDAECYREKREESLRRYARKKAQQVLKARRRTTLEPMNAYERHVIHAALQDMDNITTHSTGVEPNRCVVIEYVR